jgi:uncharacterized RDD family membrane protein YckC
MMILIISSAIYLGLVSDNTSEGSGAISGWQLLPLLLIWFLFLPLIESFNGQTLGKGLTSLRVATISGDRLTLKHSLLRHLADPLDFFFGFILCLLSSNTGLFTRRIGDYIAGTAVVAYSPVTCPYCRAVFLPTPPELSSNQLLCTSCKNTVVISMNLD